MISNPKFVLLLKRLLEKTKLGRLKWQATSSPYAFRVGFERGLVRVGLDAIEDDDEPAGTGSHYAVLIAPPGQVLESVSGKIPSDGPLPGDLLEELYAAARRTALDTDEVIEELLSHVDAEKWDKS